MNKETKLTGHNCAKSHYFLLLLIKIEDLNLLFLGFFGLQLPHEFPIAGTPDELPQPKMLISTDINLNSKKD